MTGRVQTQFDPSDAGEQAGDNVFTPRRGASWGCGTAGYHVREDIDLRGVLKRLHATWAADFPQGESVRLWHSHHFTANPSQLTLGYGIT
jgi:hypothetical protein